MLTPNLILLANIFSTHLCTAVFQTSAAFFFQNFYPSLQYWIDDINIYDSSLSNNVFIIA
jgi:hypothetical protein